MFILETIDFCADHSRDSSRAGVSRSDSRARDTPLETNPVRMLILETVCVLKLTFNEMMKLSVSLFLFDFQAQVQSLLLDHVRMSVRT